MTLDSYAWRFARTRDGSLYAACWGVNDGLGGLYKQVANTMKLVNTEYGIESKKLWDMYYHPDHDKLYVASLDKGLYVVDLNPIV